MNDHDPGTRAPDGAGRDWRDRAACRGSTDMELFFPTAEAGPARAAQVAAAKAVCARCPVVAACLTEALARIPYGICGGLTESERRRLRARNHTAANPRTAGRQGSGLSAEAAAVLTDGPDRGVTVGQRARMGRELLADGRPTSRVASACRVSERTVQRWAAGRPGPSTSNDRTTSVGTTSSASSSGGGRGAAAATGLPSGSPTAIDTQAGTRAAEEGRA